MQKWIAAQTVLRLGEMIKAEPKDDVPFTGQVVAVSPSSARIMLPGGKLKLVPATPALNDGVYRMATA
jgi:hypothetical protein